MDFTETASAEPASAEPASAEPASAEPASSEPASAEGSATSRADGPSDVLAAIALALEFARDVGDASLEDQAERYQSLHSTLQGALSDTDLPDSG